MGTRRRSFLSVKVNKINILGVDGRGDDCSALARYLHHSGVGFSTKVYFTGGFIMFTCMFSLLRNLNVSEKWLSNSLLLTIIQSKF